MLKVSAAALVLVMTLSPIAAAVCQLDCAPGFAASATAKGLGCHTADAAAAATSLNVPTHCSHDGPAGLVAKLANRIEVDPQSGKPLAAAPLFVSTASGNSGLLKATGPPGTVGPPAPPFLPLVLRI